MAVYEALLLNTVVPQIQAAQAGDSYVMVVNATTPALRITQTGTGDSILVEDSANPDSSPFVVTAAGDVGIGTSSPGVKLDVVGQGRVIYDTGATNTGDQSVVVVGAATSGAYASTYGAGLQFQVTNSGGGYSGSRIVSRLGADNNTANLVFQARNYGYADSMTLDSSGNLGIGTNTNPIGRLQVRAANPQVWMEDSAAGLNGKFTAIGTSNGTMTFNRYLDNGTLVGQYMTLDSIGNLGVGTTSPVNLSGAGDLTAQRIFASQRSTAFPAIAFATDTNTGIDWPAADTLAFNTGGTERARITSGGNSLVGTQTDSGARCTIDAASATNAVNIALPSYDYFGISIHNKATSNDNSFIAFGTEASFTARGSITYNRAGGLVAYNTTSDYRAKDVTGPVANSGATIDALKVYNGKMKGATVERPMLIAHEAQEVTPYAVTGEKDAVDEDGKPKYQQMDVSSLVPLLIAELQSLRARVAQLEAK
jgi:hypothetical protein